jgi:hypothetical protein
MGLVKIQILASAGDGLPAAAVLPVAISEAAAAIA